MSAITTSTGRCPVSGASTAPDQGGQFRYRDRPLGPDLHGHPAAADHDALNFAARQVGGDLAELAAVKPGHARASPDGGSDGIDIDAVNYCGPGHAVARWQGHATREGAAVSWSSSVGR